MRRSFGFLEARMEICQTFGSERVINRRARMCSNVTIEFILRDLHVLAGWNSNLCT